MKPGIDDLIHRSQNKPLDQTQIKIFADAPLHLTLFHDFSDDVQVHIRHFPNLIFHHTCALVRLRLVENCHISVCLKLFQMSPDQVSKLINGIFGLIHFFSETPENLLGLVIEKLNQNIIFVFEIKIDGAVGHAGFFSNLGNGRLKESVFRKYLDSRLEYPMVFIVFSALFINIAPPETSVLIIMNEYSFSLYIKVVLVKPILNLLINAITFY